MKLLNLTLNKVINSISDSIYGKVTCLAQNQIKDNRVVMYSRYKYNKESNNIALKRTEKLSPSESVAVTPSYILLIAGIRFISIIELIYKYYYENLIAIIEIVSTLIFHIKVKIDLVKRYYFAVADSHPATQNKLPIQILIANSRYINIRYVLGYRKLLHSQM